MRDYVDKEKKRKRGMENMLINNDIKELILKTIPKYYTSEASFYKINGIKFPDNNWQKFKNGETKIERIGSARVFNMLNRLFTSYELALISEAQLEYSFDRNKKEFKDIEFYTYFDMFKKEHLKKWIKKYPDTLCGQVDRTITAKGDYTPSFLHVYIDDTFCKMRFRYKVAKVPAGHKNRFEWIRDNLYKLI